MAGAVLWAERRQGSYASFCIVMICLVFYKLLFRSMFGSWSFGRLILYGEDIEVKTEVQTV